VVDDSFLVLLNSNHEPIDFLLPPKQYGETWTVVVDTSTARGGDGDEPHAAGSTIRLEARSTLVLTRPRRAQG
jgi:glycogen operon protein